MMEEKIFFMKEALKQAQRAYNNNEVPIGAVIVQDGKIIARGYNKREKYQDVTLHAEIIAIRKACKKLGSWRLNDCELYVTLEPCPMCMGAIIQSRIKKIFYAAKDPKGGALGSVVDLGRAKLFNHNVDIENGILEEESAELIKDFFKQKRLLAKFDKAK